MSREDMIERVVEKLMNEGWSEEKAYARAEKMSNRELAKQSS